MVSFRFPKILGQTLIWVPGYKTFFMLNTAEHEISDAHKYENIKKFSIFQGQISLEWHLNIYEQEKFHA